jgi:hypothetical protein
MDTIRANGAEFPQSAHAAKVDDFSASSSTNAQATTMLDPLSCAFCGQSGHFIA